MATLPVDPQLYATFLGVMATMAVTPGPANLFAVATGVARGKRAALLGVVGMNLATLVWFGAAALGLGALVTAFPEAFRIIAVLGAVYVAWLGLKTIWTGLQPSIKGAAPDQLRLHPSRSALVDGFAVQIANPKIVLFFSAVLPPFLDVARPAAPQLALFALATIGADILAMTAYGLGGAALTRRMRQPRFRIGFALFSGGLLVLAAVLIVLRF